MESVDFRLRFYIVQVLKLSALLCVKGTVVHTAGGKCSKDYREILYLF